MRASLFGTFDSELYREIRLSKLPEVNWLSELPEVNREHGLNRSEPLKSLPTGSESIGDDVTTYRRLRTLGNCLNSGRIHIGFHPRRKHVRNGSYQFSLFNESFTLPKGVAISRKLESQVEISV